jgi:predicted metal-dependent HD superfamily phosphohydrolase
VQPDNLDRQRWTALWSRLGASGNGLAVFTRLSLAYAEPARAYHTADHIRDCLTELDRVRDLTQTPDEVEAALWFHDAVYTPGASDNEDRSARLAEEVLGTSAVPAPKSHRIAALVLATSHVGPAETAAARWLCDIDLSILGRAPGEFDEFERRIRQEYGWIPEATYRRERAAVLTRFLQRPSVYQTDDFRRRYEKPARANLQRLIQSLTLPGDQNPQTVRL